MPATAATKTPVPAVILVRVSTSQQDTARQVSELQAVATAKGWQVVEVIEEQISGTSSRRVGLDKALALVQAGKVKKVLVHEVSRLARKNSVAHKFLEELETAGGSLYWHAQGIETLLENGRRNPAASIMFSLLAELARSERETIVERINSGLAEARRKGVALGRRQGSKVSDADFLAKHADVARLLKAGQSIRNAAKISGKATRTVQRVKHMLETAKGPPSKD